MPAECVARLKQAHPQIEFVMLTTYDDTDLIFNAVQAGADGYLLKRSVPDELLKAIMQLGVDPAKVVVHGARADAEHLRDAFVSQPPWPKDPRAPVRVKETLNNVVKHSGAGVVRLGIEVVGDTLRVVVTDDGRGFEPGREPADANGPSQHARADGQIAGRYRIESRSGEGTRVILELPFSS